MSEEKKETEEQTEQPQEQSGQPTESSAPETTQAAEQQEQTGEQAEQAGTETTPSDIQPADAIAPVAVAVSGQDESNSETPATASAESVQSAPPATDEEKHTLRASSLYKSFGKKKVVQGVDFSMTTGEVLGLLGPNGAGKTTTFYMIVGFHKPTNGEIFLDDHRLTPLPMYKRARLGISYLPQEPSVFRKLTVEENIWSILETRHDLSRAQKKQRLEELIEEFSIGRIRKQPAFTLSGGERRRTEIARSLAIEPKFLLLDEPFAGIDPIAVADIKGMIKLLAQRGIGILITDHNVRDTLEITDRAIIISTGQIMIQGSKEEILASEVAREIYLGKDFSM